jgi:hypothetical protein
MDIDALTDEDIGALCKKYSVAVFDASNSAPLGIPSAPAGAKRRPVPCAVPLDAKRPRLPLEQGRGKGF